MRKKAGVEQEPTVKWVYLDTVFKCDRCATVRENLNLETVHVCRCRDSGPVWQQVRRWRPNWTLILAVLLCGAIAYCVWNAVLWWHSPENREEPALREGRGHMALALVAPCAGGDQRGQRAAQFDHRVSPDRSAGKE